MQKTLCLSNEIIIIMKKLIYKNLISNKSTRNADKKLHCKRAFPIFFFYLDCNSG